MNRKSLTFLMIFAMAFAGYSMQSVSAVSTSQDVELVFFAGSQTSDTVQNMVDDYNSQTDGVTVSFEQGTWSTNEQYDSYVSRFQAEDDTFDVISMDVIWPSSFIVNDWLAPLDDVFPASEQAKFLQAPITAGSFGGSIYGMPWFHDSGLLFYRTDILTDAFNNGLIPANRAPETWAELHDWTLAMVDNSTFISNYEDTAGDMKGFVWQGKAYEGLMCDFMEYLGGTGQHSWLTEDSDGKFSPSLDTQNVKDALAYMQSLVEDGVSPSAVTTYDEEGSRNVWDVGNSIFHRNWPYAYRLSLQSEALNGTDTGGDKIFAVAPMPAQNADVEDPLTGCLGGWQLGVNAFSKHTAEAKDFVLWLTAEKQQLTHLEGDGSLPTRISAYDADKIAGTDLDYIVDYLPAFKQAISRPVHPDYPDMSKELWAPLNAVVAGTKTPAAASSEMQDDVNAILTENVTQAPFNIFFAMVGLGTLAVAVRKYKKYKY
jgi:multiple sugar transport system substrate-binding protein